MTGTIDCPECDGCGEFTGFNSVSIVSEHDGAYCVECEKCCGTGELTTDTCPTCDGERLVDKASPGWNDPHHTIRVSCPTCTV